MHMTSPVAIFDSGVGGLSILQAMSSMAPGQSILYFADTAFHPYGQRTASFAQERYWKILNWLKEKDVKLVIVACHSLSGFDSSFCPIACIDMLSPTIDAIKNINPNKLGLMATPLSVQRGVLVERLKASGFSGSIVPLACPTLAPAIEAHDGDHVRRIFQESLAFFKEHKVDAIVHGCTHYPLAQRFMTLPSLFIDPSIQVAHHVHKLLSKSGLLQTSGPTNVTFYHTGPIAHLKVYLCADQHYTFIPCLPDLG